jgi:hypothetical protein
MGCSVEELIKVDPLAKVEVTVVMPAATFERLTWDAMRYGLNRDDLLVQYLAHGMAANDRLRKKAAGAGITA